MTSENNPQQQGWEHSPSQTVVSPDQGRQRVASNDNRQPLKNPRAQIYLTRAQEAEEQAGKAFDAELRASWLKIAQGYRDLIKLVEGQ